ncbi:hypothetical protein CK203_109916 [Vitis vinifera]|uniref:Uncharacterized protein n=1 Tax=Vitis vinifera TaxID=29760 RepID=A0A438CB68_VITVI|nr:hypothetical protein CK203_109916 [Vitis vinifera]
MDPHGLARSSLIGCSSRRGHDRYLTESLRSPSRVRTSRHLDSIMPLHLGAHTGAYFPFRMDLRTFIEVTCAMMDVFTTFVLRTCHAPDAILGHIPFRRIFMDLRRGHRSPLVYMIIHGYGIHARSMFDFILSGHSEEPLLSHSARFIPFCIVVIPGWSCLWCLDFPRHHFRGPWRRSFPHISVTVSITRSRYIVFASLTIVPEFFVDMSSECLAFRAAVHSRFTTFGVASSVSTFRVVITSQFDVQSHHHHFSVSAFRAIIEPSSIFRLTFRAASSFSAFRVVITSQFDVQSHHHHFSVSAFRAIIEPSSIFRLTFRAASSFSAFRVVITSQFDVQSHHHHFSVSAFRAVIDFQIDIQSHILEPSSIFRLTFRAASSFSAFRVVITSQFDVQSHHHHFSVSVIKAIIDFQIDIQSHILDRNSESHPRFRRSESLSLLSLTFRVIIITSQFRRSELSSVFRSTFRVASSVSAFRVVITSQFDVQSHHHHFSVSAFRAIIGFQIDIQSRILESALSSRITTPGVHIHWLCASCLHCFALSLGFSSLRYPVFIVYSSRSPHRVVPFGRILARTPGWCDNYSSLTLISWVAFRDILEGVWVLEAALEGMQGFWDGRWDGVRGWLVEEDSKNRGGGGLSGSRGRPQRSPRSRERPDLGRDNWSERGRNTPRSRIGRSRYSLG